MASVGRNGCLFSMVWGRNRSSNGQIEFSRAMQTYKIVVFVPEDDGERVRAAMGEAGAGRIGNYDRCSFTTKGIGRSPAIDIYPLAAVE
jgi:hypothetical protein